MINSEQPAFPLKETNKTLENFYGLSKRELIAAMAMSGMINLTSNKFTPQEIEHDIGIVLKYTDELLKQLKPE